jgi:excinuclease UvrABC nuclease subunit
MTPVVLSLLLTGGGVLCAAGGYAARVLVERFQERQRERAHAALSGELPQWEQTARELEDNADLAELNLHFVQARQLRRQAKTLRRVSHQRIRRGVDPLRVKYTKPGGQS